MSFSLPFFPRGSDMNERLLYDWFWKEQGTKGNFLYNVVSFVRRHWVSLCFCLLSCRSIDILGEKLWLGIGGFSKGGYIANPKTFYPLTGYVVSWSILPSSAYEKEIKREET